MAFKIKDNLDLYGYLLQNFCIDNYDSIENATQALGRTFVFTGNEDDYRYHRVTVFDGTSFRGLAFYDEIANNEEFNALKEKVDLILGGEIDADGIIENWKEVEAFLEGISDTQDLVTLLNSKLDKSGGTISGDLTIKKESGESTLILGTNGRVIYNPTNDSTALFNGGSGYPTLSVQAGLGHPTFRYDYKNYALLHSGNVGDYAIKSLGYVEDVTDADFVMTPGTATIIPYFQTLNGENIGSYRMGLLRIAGGSSESQLAFDHYNGVIKYRNYLTSWSDWKTIAFTESYVAGLAHPTSGVVEVIVNESGNVGIGTTDPQAKLGVDGDVVIPNNFSYKILDTAGTARRVIHLNSANGLLIGQHTAINAYSTNLYGYAISFIHGTGGTLGMLLNSSGNVTIGSEDLAGTSRKLFVSGGSAFFVNTQNNITSSDQLDRTKTFSISAANNDTYNYGLHVWIDTSGRSNLQSSYAGSAESKSTYPIALNPLGGNVLIGTTEDNGSGAKLQVDGGISTSGEVYLNHNKSIRLKGSNGTNYNALFTSGTDLQIGYDSPAIRFGVAKMFINSSGNVGIGTDNPVQLLDVRGNITIPNYSALMSRNTDGTGINLIYAGNDDIIKIGGALPILLNSDTTVNGDLHVKGNIIADKEVSAGGAGEEGTGGGGSGALMWQEEFTPSASNSIPIAHGLGTENVVISLYEQDSESGRWVMCLTDIEIVDDDNIIINFGSTSSIVHKVVIMGASV